MWGVSSSSTCAVPNRRLHNVKLESNSFCFLFREGSRQRCRRAAGPANISRWLLGPPTSAAGCCGRQLLQRAATERLRAGAARGQSRSAWAFDLPASSRRVKSFP